MPKTLTFLAANGANGSSVVLKNVQYSNPKGSSGKGELSIDLAGKHLATLPGSVFEAVTAQSDGTVTAGSVMIGNDVSAPDFFQSGVNVLFEAQAKAISVATPAAGKISVKQIGAVEFSGGIRLLLPYFSASGEQAEVELAKMQRSVSGTMTVPAVMSMKADGSFSITDQPIQFLKPSLAPTTGGGLKIAGIRIIPASMSVTFFHTAGANKPYEFLIQGGAGVLTYVPNLLTQEDTPLDLVSDNLKLNEEGIVSFDAKGPNFVGGFDFAQPMDFAMYPLTSANASYSSDHFTKFSMEGDLVLPTSVSDLTTPIHPARATLRGVKLNMNSNQKWDITPGNQGGTVFFGTDPQAPYKLSIQSYSLDLSANGRVTVNSGELSRGMFGQGQTVQLNPNDLFIDTFGVSGSVAMPASFKSSVKVGGFEVVARADPDSRLTFKQNAKVGASNLPGQVVLNDMGTLFVRVNLPDNGATVITVDPDKPLTMLSMNKFKVGVAVSATALDLSEDGNYNLELTGAVTFNTGSFGNLPVGVVTADIALPFSAIDLDATKGFVTPNADGLISLDNPVGLNVGLFSLNVSQFRFPVPNDDAIKLTGGVQLSGDLPLSGELDFSGLRISSGGSLDFGKITFTDLTLMDVATVSGSLTKQEIAVGNDPPRSYLFGDITKFNLNFAGDMQGNLHFLVGNGSWLVLGSVQLPNSIPLGDSGFALYGFRGGLGHNVKFRNPIDPNFKATDLQSTDFLPTKDGNWIFMAGVRVGTEDAFLLWGDATLTVTTQPLLINLNLAAYLLEQMSDNPSGDRTALGNMTYDSGTSSFRTTAQVDLNFPTRSASVAGATGSADLLISPSDTHVWIGWPPFAPVGIKILGTPGLGGGLALGPGRNFGANFSWGRDFYFISGEIDGTLNANLDNGLVLVGVLHASGDVDFFVFTASAEAMLQARMQSSPFELDLTGSFRGCVGIKWVGHVCKTLGPTTFAVK